MPRAEARGFGALIEPRALEGRQIGPRSTDGLSPFQGLGSALGAGIHQLPLVATGERPLAGSDGNGEHRAGRIACATDGSRRSPSSRRERGTEGALALT